MTIITPPHGIYSNKFPTVPYSEEHAPEETKKAYDGTTYKLLKQAIVMAII